MQCILQSVLQYNSGAFDTTDALWAGDGPAGPRGVCVCAGPQPEGVAPADMARVVRP